MKRKWCIGPNYYIHKIDWCGRRQNKSKNFVIKISFEKKIFLGAFHQLLQHELSSLGNDHCILLDNLHNVKELVKSTPVQIIIISIIIYCYLAVPHPTLGHCWGTTSPTRNHCVCKILIQMPPGASEWR